jgi:hypothetical protein
MRKFILAALAASLAALAIVPALASADVQRYQMETATLTADLGPNVVRDHTYNITINPCDGTFTGTSDLASTGYDETIKGTLNNDGTVTFVAKYQPDSQAAYTGGQPYSWGMTDARLGAQANMWDSWGENLPATASLSTPVNATTYQNHGQYVSSVGGGADAAHSCIGMPINSSN